MATLKIGREWALVLALGLAVGCGGGGGGSSTVAPDAGQQGQAQMADAASSGIEGTQDASNTALVEAGAPGSTTSASGATSINFLGSVTLTVDLDALNGMGQDVYPNASGKFTVTATGTVTGTASAGQVTYSVQVTWITPGVFTDPVCGDVATIASSSSWSYSLVVQWSKTDGLNWSIQATSDVNGSLNATVTDHVKTWTVTGTVTRHASATFSRTAGTYAFAFGINGQRTVVVTDGTETHTVTITMTALDHIMVQVDASVFGPYTLAEIRWWFGFDCNG